MYMYVIWYIITSIDVKYILKMKILTVDSLDPGVNPFPKVSCTAQR